MCNLLEAFQSSLIKSEIRRRIKSWIESVLYVLHNCEMQEEAETFWTHNMAGYIEINDVSSYHRGKCFTFDNYVLWSVHGFSGRPLILFFRGP